MTTPFARHRRRFLRAVSALGAVALILPLTSCATGGATGLSGRGSANPGDRWVLFVGNSLTYQNDLPDMLERVARLSGDDSLRAAVIASPDYALEDHYLGGEVQRALAAYDWSIVVMQQGPSSLPASQDHLRAWTAAFAPLIREAGAEPMLYQVWPAAVRRGLDAANVLTSYTNAAAAVDGILAPAGDAFTAALDADPAIGIHAGDGFHPSARGTYLAAITILARINEMDPRSLPPTIPRHSAPDSVVRALQDAAAVALARNPERP